MKQPEAWSRYAERILATGARLHFAPEPETLAVHACELAAARTRLGRAPEVLVLGATPELADLALGFGCRSRRVDCNPAMFAAAHKREESRDRSGETCIEADWLDMPMLADASIDLVLGDNSLNNVAHEQMPRLLAELARVTHAGSVLSLRQFVFPNTPMPGSLSVGRVVARYRDGEFGAHEFSRALRYGSFVDAVWDPERRLFDAARVFEQIDAAHARGVFNTDEYAFMNGRRSQIQHTIYRHGEQVALFAPLGRCRVERAGPVSDFEYAFAVWVIERSKPA